MICPACQQIVRSMVLNSRETLDGKEVIRRRACPSCQHRWYTRELSAARLQTPIPVYTKSRARRRWATSPGG